MAAALIPFTSGDPNGYKIPSSLTATTTPQGGSAFKDTEGNMYIKGTAGYTLAPATLPGNPSNAMAQPVTTPAATTTATPTPIQGPTPAVPVQPVMPPNVKTAIETAANAGGSSLGSGVPVNPSKSSPTTVDYTLHNGESVDQYNTRISQEEQAAGVNASPTSSGSKVPNINDYLATAGQAPTRPDLNADQTAAENSIGIPAIQTNIQNLTTQLQQAQNEALIKMGAEASKPGVVASIINGRIRMISAEDAVAIKGITDQIKSAQEQLTAANTAVATFMKNDQTNYQNASDAYNKAFTAALTQYNDAVSQQDKQQTAAKANAQVIINSYKDSTAGTNSITDTDRAQWNSLELQAGLPAGTIETAVQNEMNITKFTKGFDGNSYVQGIDANGNPYTAKVEGSYGTGSKPTNPTSNNSDLATNTDTMEGFIKDQIAGDDKRKDNYLSPQEWAKAKQEWIKQGKGYTSAQFNSLFGGYKNPDKTQKYD